MTDDAELSRRAFLLGTAGATAAGAAGTATAQESGNESDGGGGGDTTTSSGGSGNESGGGGDGGGGDGGGGGGGGGGPTKTVTVGPGGDLVFEPGTSEPLQVTPGTTVKFVWDSDNHNVVVDSQPDGANWKGTPGAPSKTYNSGYTYTHTFETLGTYEYYCDPHKTAGMTGTIEVVESISTPAPATVPQVPESAKTLGVATSVSMAVTLGLAFFFIKYGGDYETPDE